jgi:hypothetical protein
MLHVGAAREDEIEALMGLEMMCGARTVLSREHAAGVAKNRQAMLSTSYAGTMRI